MQLRIWQEDGGDRMKRIVHKNTIRQKKGLSFTRVLLFSSVSKASLVQQANRSSLSRAAGP